LKGDLKMRIAYARREEMQEISGVHGGAGSILFKSLFEGDDFGTPWRFIHSAILPPGGGIGHHRHDTAEEVFVTIDNAAQFTHNGRTAEVIGSAAVPLRQGESHAIYNHTDKETRWFNFNVAAVGKPADSTDFGDDRANAPLESVDRLPVARLDRNLLAYHSSHQGKGEVGVRMLWEHQDFRNNWGFVGHALLPPGTSVGYHRHDTIEEAYIIMNGSGRMTVDNETEEVYPGAVIPNRLGGSHGIYNHTQEDLEMLVVAVCLERSKIDATNLGDNLTTR
jgi:mannose-6-phosphate isomerase-like protein (cupin superfamily)